MPNKVDEFNNLPLWVQRLLPWISLILSILAFPYIIYLTHQASLEFVHWMRMVIFAVMGLALLFSAVIYPFNKVTAWKWLLGGLSLLPLLLCLQLILLCFRILSIVAHSMIRGTLPEPIRIFIENYPSKADVLILLVLFSLGVFWIIDRLKNKEK